MNELKEIPVFETTYTALELTGIAVLSFIVVFAGFFLWSLFWETKAKRNPDAKPYYISSHEKKTVHFLMAVISVLVAAGVLPIVSAGTFQGNKGEMKSVAFENISKIYDLKELTVEDLSFDFEDDSKKIEQITGVYDDLDSATRYDLTFVFKDNKEPILMKTGNVTEEFIKTVKK